MVREETYRYEGQKPTSPESAIIMLADSVEAAAKAMENPTVKKMQDLIRAIFRQKMDDGQLDDAQLTLGDMHKIRDVFENGLRGLAGHRIAYPRRRSPWSRVGTSAPPCSGCGGDGCPDRNGGLRAASVAEHPRGVSGGAAMGGPARMERSTPTAAAAMATAPAVATRTARTRRRRRWR